MSVVLYKPKDDGTVETGYFPPEILHSTLQAGWFLEKDCIGAIEEPIEMEADTPLLEDMSNEEIRELAKEAGIENHEDARIKTLIRKLREYNGTVEG